MNRLRFEPKERKSNHAKIGRRLIIPAKSYVSFNKMGFQQTWYVDTVTICIGIGKDNTAELTMDIESWEALKKGAKIHII